MPDNCVLVLDTLAKLYAHGHGVGGYCRACRRLFSVSMPDLIRDCGADSPVVGMRPLTGRLAVAGSADLRLFGKLCGNTIEELVRDSASCYRRRRPCRQHGSRRRHRAKTGTVKELFQAYAQSLRAARTVRRRKHRVGRAAKLPGRWQAAARMAQ